MLLRHQVFVSSTFLDLQDERQAAVEAILQAGHIPAGMELFAAEDRAQMDVIKEWINDSDIYMLILGSRYGSIEPESGWSYTEVEYRYALDSGKPVFALVLSEDAINKKHKKLASKASDHPDKLKTFRSFVMTKMVRQVDNRDQIKLFTLESLQRLVRRHANLPGWARSTLSSHDVAAELARLTLANAKLVEENARLKERSDPSTVDVDRWARTLRLFKIPDEHEKGETDILDALTNYQQAFAMGVTNSAQNTPFLKWLFMVATKLAPLGLTERGKVPPEANWTRLQLSKEGIEVVKAVMHKIGEQQAKKKRTNFPTQPDVPDTAEPKSEVAKPETTSPTVDAARPSHEAKASAKRKKKG